MRKQNREVHFDKEGRYVDPDERTRPQRQTLDELATPRCTDMTRVSISVDGAVTRPLRRLRRVGGLAYLCS